MNFNSAVESRHKVIYEISPNEYDFKNTMRDIINGLEASVGKYFVRYFVCISENKSILCLGQVCSLCDHPTLRLFSSYPNYDPINPQSRTPIFTSEIRWPDVDFLFGDDVEHQEIVVETLNTVNRALNNVQSFVKV